MGVLGGAPMAFAWPALAVLNVHILSQIHAKLAYFSVLWPLLVLIATVKSVFATLSFTAVMIQVSIS